MRLIGKVENLKVLVEKYGNIKISELILILILNNENMAA